MHRRFAELPAAILLGPVYAATPILALALAAFVAQSATYRGFVDAAFGFLLIAWPATAMIGLPLHLILARFRLEGLAHAVAGTAIAVLLAWLGRDAAVALPDAAHPWRAHTAWPWTAWTGVALQGALTGYLFFRRIDRPMPRRWRPMRRSGA
ncbi:MAG: hypothetical protein AB7P21_03010 [Lautropia sp.]